MVKIKQYTEIQAHIQCVSQWFSTQGPRSTFKGSMKGYKFPTVKLIFSNVLF